jgi:exosortase
LNDRISSAHGLNSALLLLAPSWLAMGWLVSKAQWFWNNRPDLQFGWVVLLLCGYLFFEAWQTRPQLQGQLRASAIIVGAGALGALFMIQIYQVAFGTNAASMMALALGLLGVVTANLLFLFGWAGPRHFGFAFAFILIAMPLPSIIYNPLVGGLQSKVATVNVEVLNLIGIPARQVGSLIHLPNGTVGVDEACSGIRSLQSAVMATLFIGYLTLRLKTSQILLLAGGVAAAILGNLARSLFLSYTANSRGVQALGEVHDAAGWSILAFTIAVVFLLARALAKLERVRETPAGSSPE